MSDDKEKSLKTASPCARNCCLDGDDICLGCFRSITEIIQWTMVDDPTRQQFLKNIAERKLHHKSAGK